MSHEMKVASQLQLRDVGNIIIHAPEGLDGGNSIDLLQVGFVFG